MALFCRNATSQVQSIDQTTSSLIEDYLTKRETIYDFSALLEETQNLLGSKTDINTSNDEALRLLGLNDQQIQALADYIAKYGIISGVYELNLVEGFDSTFIVKILPKIWFNTNQELHQINLKNLLTRGNHTLITRYERTLQKQKGYQASIEDGLAAPPEYAGSPDNVLIRYRYKYYDRLQFGITAEKDAGERGKNYFDYYSFHLLYKSAGFIKNLALGDYDLSFGQGLIMNTGFNLSKNPGSPDVTRKTNSVRARAGANESGGLRGIALTLAPLSIARMTFFYSAKFLDGSQKDADSLSDEPFITSIRETGLHRTLSEIDNKQVVKQEVLGTNVTLQYKYLIMGATAVRTHMTGRFVSDNKPYNVFNTQKNLINNFGLNLSFIYRTLTVLADAVSDNNGNVAALTSITIRPNTDYSFSALYRNYPKNYLNPHSASFSENSECSNEEGFYLAFRGQVLKKLLVTAYADIFRFPWLKYLVDAPSKGTEYASTLQYTVNRSAEFSLRYSHLSKMRNPSEGSMINTELPKSDIKNEIDVPYPVDINKQSIRMEMTFHPKGAYQLKSRIECTQNSTADNEKTNGYLFMQDIRYAAQKIPWTFHFRYAAFDTETYNDRIYAWESDLLYTFSVPVFHGNGHRISLVGHYTVNKNISLWFKYAHTYMPNVAAIGSGNEEITGPLKSEVKFQAVIHL